MISIKRLIGRRFGDNSVQDDIKTSPLKVINKNGTPVVEVQFKGQFKTFTPEEISAMILREMKEMAKEYLSQTITRAVITVPVGFTDTQRQATKDTGRIASLEAVRLINESAGAAIANGDRVFKIIVITSIIHLGGQDFDQRVINYFIEQYNNANYSNIAKDLQAMGELRREAEKVKMTFSSQSAAGIEIASLHDGKRFSKAPARAKLEEFNADLFQKTLDTVDEVLKDANGIKNDINCVVSVDGSTRIPKVVQLFERYFGRKPSRDINLDEAV